MGGVDAHGPLWFGFGTDSEQRFNDCFPVRAVSVCIEKS
jgi:hypothetical protein